MTEADDGGAAEQFKVVVNDEGQYSLWFADLEQPPGWAEAGKRGTREECLAYVEEVWTDMRPVPRQSIGTNAAHAPS